MKFDIDKRIGVMVARMRREANNGVWSGDGMSPYMMRCRHMDYQIGIIALFTRDIGHHSSGWWKNPDYERCFHLSLSFFDPETNERGPRNEDLSQLMAPIQLTHQRKDETRWQRKQLRSPNVIRPTICVGKPAMRCVSSQATSKGGVTTT